eukprot:160011-Prymnesium_polylepis.1
MRHVDNAGRHLLLARHHVSRHGCYAPAVGRNMVFCDCRGARNARPCSDGMHVDVFVRRGGSTHQALMSVFGCGHPLVLMRFARAPCAQAALGAYAFAQVPFSGVAVGAVPARSAQSGGIPLDGRCPTRPRTPDPKRCNNRFR